ncbi:hypothetical protein RR48_13073 [Papilio machaon]|uniref:Uncharacterized protein n=1 Tax=Papilio machaon TaxID=76193 RepID=A0A194QSN7_PAPMA|nr:hypothetical protein RR48_13073 [Papilio machaon]
MFVTTVSSAAQALAAVCARAELEALAEWAAEIESVIERPLRDYAHFVDACFGPFSVQIAKTGAYKQLEKECNELVMSVREKLSARRRDLALGLTDAARVRVRMTAPDLRVSVQLYFVLLEIVVWHIGLLGVLQPLAALLVAVVLCPLGALLLLVGGVSWWAARGVWEAAAWRAVIVRAARVPAHDSAFCRRVAGPGLHTRACYQITAAQALAAVCARAELEALAEWAAEIESVIERPLRDYAHFVDACFGPFSVQIAKVFDAEILVALEEGEARLSLEGGEAARAWAARCGRGLAPPDVLAERDHWRRDPHEPQPHGVWGEWSGTPAPRVPPPSLDVSAFSPRAPLQPPVPHPAAVALVLHNSAWFALCQYSRTVVLAWTVLGRWRALEWTTCAHWCQESDNPVPLDSELCADILRTLEDAPDIDDRRDEKCGSEVERYRGGGSSASSSASGSASSAPSSAGSPDDDRADCAHDTALCR